MTVAYYVACISDWQTSIKCEPITVLLEQNRTQYIMGHPPGLMYLFRRLPFFFLPPIVVYVAFKAGKQYLGLCPPTWITVVATLLARPAWTFARNQYTDLNDKRAAASLGAVLAPHVKESPFAVAKKTAGSIDDFPGLSSSSLFAFVTDTYNSVQRGYDG